MTKTKLNTLLAITDSLAGSFKKSFEDYVKFFKNSQGAFKGEKKTYEPSPGTIDIPSNRKNVLVVTTVEEKLNYLKNISKDYIDALFSQEKTNASGKAKATLMVDGINFGEFTSLELLRLKSILESGTLKDMYENVPVRNDDELWIKTLNDLYTGRKIFESELQRGITKSTTKESYILLDPNKVEGSKYVPQVASKDTVIDLGTYTHQRFSGETSHVERAAILTRRTKLLTAVIAALKISNDIEAETSDMTSDKLFNYLHTGKI